MFRNCIHNAVVFKGWQRRGESLLQHLIKPVFSVIIYELGEKVQFPADIVDTGPDTNVGVSRAEYNFPSSLIDAAAFTLELGVIGHCKARPEDFLLELSSAMRPLGKDHPHDGIMYSIVLLLLLSPARSSSLIFWIIIDCLIYVKNMIMKLFTTP